MDSSDSSDGEVYLTPEAIKLQAKTAIDSLLPELSKERYMKTYNHFMTWRSAKSVKSLSESVFLAYFSEMAKTWKPSTLWSTYSMLKSTIHNKHQVDLKNFANLLAFLKRQSENFKSKKSNVFTAEEVERFLNYATDEIDLATKVVLIFGICGACRSMEFTKNTMNDVVKHDQIIIVKLLNTKTKIDRQFVIQRYFTSSLDKYQSSGIKWDRYFLNYQRGKCLRQVIGKNKFANMPRQIAAFLNLSNPELYTGHCFRRTSATLLADSGANITTLKRHGGWKSSTVAEGYVEDSVQNKSKIATKITKSINIEHQYQKFPQPGTSRDPHPEIVYASRQNSPINIENWQQISPQPGTSKDPNPNQEDLQYLRHDSLLGDKNQYSEPTSHHVRETQISQKISNINMPEKTFDLSFSNCTNFTINFH